MDIELCAIAFANAIPTTTFTNGSNMGKMRPSYATNVVQTAASFRPKSSLHVATDVLTWTFPTTELRVDAVGVTVTLADATQPGGECNVSQTALKL